MRDFGLKVGDVIEVVTERLAYGGDAIARHHGLTIFIPFAAPGERLSVQITEVKKNFARARLQKIIEPARSRRAPSCEYFGDCGGCQLQHISYEAQLDAKASFVRDALKRVGRIDWQDEIKILSANEFGYRTRAQVKIEPAGRHFDPGLMAIGFHRSGSHTVCDVERCRILVPELDRALGLVRSRLKTANGNQSNLSEIEMAAGDAGVAFEPAVGELESRTLKRTVHGLTYNFDASTFFQVNAELIEALAQEATAGYSGRLAIDLFAGVGLFTLQLARSFNQVIGVESNTRAAKFARANIKQNGFANVHFASERVESWLKDFISKRSRGDRLPDLVLLDPPRAGAATAIPLIAELRPARISYVSCDPATLARDLRDLLDSGYELDRVTAVDLFPQTYHIETIAALHCGQP